VTKHLILGAIDSIIGHACIIPIKIFLAKRMNANTREDQKMLFEITLKKYMASESTIVPLRGANLHFGGDQS